jgi:hypothetical protein
LFQFQGIWYKSGGGTSIGRTWFNVNGTAVANTSSFQFCESTGYCSYNAQWVSELTSSDYIEINVSTNSINMSMPAIAANTNPTCPTGAPVNLYVKRIS